MGFIFIYIDLQSLKSKPDFNDAGFYLAMVNDKLNNFDETEKILLELIKKDPKNVKAMNYLGYCYADKNIKLDEAEKLLNLFQQNDQASIGGKLPDDGFNFR